MDVQRVMGLVVLAAAACAPFGGAREPRPVQQESGPKGSIQAQYSGGLVMRTVNVSFRVDQSAYVIVGHLGGDGVIRVLYPETPWDFGGMMSPVRPHKTIATRPFFAGYDGAPSLYTFSMTPFRNIGAMFDSYDGRGHGYIFMIATPAPMRWESILDGDEWGEVPVRDYHRVSDPRLAIRQYAQALARGKYTLKFANSFTTQSFATYAMSAWDCSLLSSIGLDHFYGFWGSWSGAWGTRLSRYGYPSGYYAGSGCDRRAYALNDYYFDEWQRNHVHRDPGPQLTNPGITPTSPPMTPTTRRPTYRPFGERAGPGISTLTHTIPTTRGSGLGRTGSNWPTSDDSRSSVRSGSPMHRPLDSPRSYGPRTSDGPRVSSDRGSSRSPGASASAPAAPAPRPSAPAPSSTPATKSTSSATTTKHQ